MIKALYVHIPFCSSICGYCDFTKRIYEENIATKYLDRLEADLAEIKQNQFCTIYIGGGTPTSLSINLLDRLLSMLSRFKVEQKYTIEINPENFSFDKAILLSKYHINRVSIGVQSFNDNLLRHMGRRHNKKDILNTLAMLDQVGIYNRSIDLMYGFNGQRLDDVRFDLQKAVSLNITHISIYGLEIYENTIFGKLKYRKMDDETDYLCYQYIRDFLNANGFKQYEVSNFAKDGYQSKHNKIYWYYDDFIGVGASASSKIFNQRIDNDKNIVKYVSFASESQITNLNHNDIVFEAIMMNLRLIDGIRIDEFNNKFGCDLLFRYQEAIKKNVGKGLLNVSDGCLRTTEQGITVLNDILVSILCENVPK